MWARRRCHSRDSEIVSGFQVCFGDTVVGGLWGTEVCVIDNALSLFLFLLLEVVGVLVEVSAVAGDMI